VGRTLDTYILAGLDEIRKSYTMICYNFFLLRGKNHDTLAIYTIHSGGKVPPECNAIYIVKYKEDRLDVLDCVTPRKAKNQSMEKVQTR
jgi:hypothetical protein